MITRQFEQELGTLKTVWYDKIINMVMDQTFGDEPTLTIHNNGGNPCIQIGKEEYTFQSCKVADCKRDISKLLLIIQAFIDQLKRSKRCSNVFIQESESKDELILICTREDGHPITLGLKMSLQEESANVIVGLCSINDLRLGPRKFAAKVHRRCRNGIEVTIKDGPGRQYSIEIQEMLQSGLQISFNCQDVLIFVQELIGLVKNALDGSNAENPEPNNLKTSIQLGGKLDTKYFKLHIKDKSRHSTVVTRYFQHLDLQKLTLRLPDLDTNQPELREKILTKIYKRKDKIHELEVQLGMKKREKR